MTFSFKLISQDGDARRGKISTSHGNIETPAFIPVGTYGAIKAISPLNLVNFHCFSTSDRKRPK